MENEKKHHNNGVPKHKAQKNYLGKEKSTLNSNIPEGAIACNAKPSKSSAQGGGIRIVNCKNGKRIEFSQKVLSMLNHPNEINFLIRKQYLILAATEKHGFSLRGKKHNTIYSATLVTEIAKRFKLDFSSCTCLSFPRFKMIDDNSVLAIAIVME